MLINQKSVKAVYHSYGKRVSREALELLDVRVRDFINKSISASNGNITVKPEDLAHYHVKLHI